MDALTFVITQAKFHPVLPKRVLGNAKQRSDAKLSPINVERPSNAKWSKENAKSPLCLRRKPNAHAGWNPKRFVKKLKSRSLLSNLYPYHLFPNLQPTPPPQKHPVRNALQLVVIVSLPKFATPLHMECQASLTKLKGDTLVPGKLGREPGRPIRRA